MAPSLQSSAVIVGHGDTVRAGDVVDVHLHIVNNGLYGVRELTGVRILAIDGTTFVVAGGDGQTHGVGEVGGDWWRTFLRRSP